MVAQTRMVSGFNVKSYSSTKTSASFTRMRPLVRDQYRPPVDTKVVGFRDYIKTTSIVTRIVTRLQ